VLFSVNLVFSRLTVINFLEESRQVQSAVDLKGEGVDRHAILLVQMICSHDIRQIRGAPGILAKVEPLTIYSTQAKGYRIQSPKSSNMNPNAGRKSPDLMAASVATSSTREARPHIRKTNNQTLFFFFPFPGKRGGKNPPFPGYGAKGKNRYIGGLGEGEIFVGQGGP